jgi:hypothetical protein
MPEKFSTMRTLAGLSVFAVLPTWIVLAADRPMIPAEPSTDASRFPQYDHILVLENTAATSANVSIGDVDGDGHPDIVIAKGRHWPLISRVLIGDGRGHFSSGYNLGDGAYRSYSARLGDVDEDGDLDAVLSNDAPDPKLVHLNDGKGHFHEGSSYGRPEWATRNVTVVDLNGDGLPDIVVANRGNKSSNYICLNKGKGQFDTTCTAFSTESATTIAAADFNHDGLIDLAVPHRDGGQSFVYLASPRATFSNLRRVPFGPPDATIRMAEAADFDGDGVRDILAIDERQGVAIFLGRKDGAFSPGVAIDNGKAAPYALAVGDLNGDGRADIVVGNVEAPSTVLFNDGSGRHYTPVRFGDSRGTVYGFAMADLDGDGLVDIAVARSDAPNVVYFAKPPSPNIP